MACGLQVTGFLYLSEACEVLVAFCSTRIPEKCILRSNLIKGFKQPYTQHEYEIRL